MLDAYEEGKIDRLYVVFNKFVNTMTQEPTIHQLLPLPQTGSEDDVQTGSWDYLYEPDAKTLLDRAASKSLQGWGFAEQRLPDL